MEMDVQTKPRRLLRKLPRNKRRKSARTSRQNLKPLNPSPNRMFKIRLLRKQSRRRQRPRNRRGVVRVPPQITRDKAVRLPEFYTPLSTRCAPFGFLTVNGV